MDEKEYVWIADVEADDMTWAADTIDRSQLSIYMCIKCGALVPSLVLKHYGGPLKPKFLTTDLHNEYHRKHDGKE